MALKVTMAGQDISLLVKESSIQLQDQLGQGAGVASGSSGRATTCSFLVSGVGPASSAIGAGSTVSPTYKNLLSFNQSSIQTDTSGFTLNNGPTLTRDTSIYWQGGASLRVDCPGLVGGEGFKCLFGASSFIAGRQYTFSLYMLGSGSISLLCQNRDNGSTVGTQTLVNLTGAWQRVVCTVTAPTTTSGLAMRVATAGTTATTYWCDGLQVEQSATATAWAYGGVPANPKLVRLSDIAVYDSTNTQIFGGKVIMLEDQTVKKTNYVKVSCVDYWQFLETVIVNKVYTATDDVTIIKDLLNTYATWINQSYLPSSGSITLSVENFTHFTLRKALQRITDKSGYNIWITPDKHIQYLDPTKSPAAPFSLSDSPNFTSSFQCGVDDYTVDDTSAINRVFFYGGKSLSNDLTQDLSTQCNGTNDLFVLAYYPHKSSDGQFHLKKNGVDVNLGFVGGTGASNTLVKDGGTADALLNIDSHTIQWSTAPTAGTTVQFVYRREIPLLVVITDESSHSYYGVYLDGVISDQSVFDQTVAVRRCQTLLYEQSFGLETLQIRCWKAGIQAGQIIRVDHTMRNIHKSFIVQTVQVNPKGGGFFEYVLTCGAWHINLVDAVMQLARLATPEDDSSTEQETALAIASAQERIGLHVNWATSTRTMGMYYPQATPVGDGHDAYPGLCSI